MSRQTSTPTYPQLWRSGLWQDNPAIVKLLGLCPLLAVSNTAVNGLGLGVATLVTLLVSNTLTSLLRPVLDNAIRIPLYVLVIATTVTIIELLMKAWLPALHASLGIFLPLIVTNCLIIGRAEAFASRQPLAASLHDALSMGMGFLWVLVSLGAARELVGQGTVLDDAHLLFGDYAKSWVIQLFDSDNGLLIALLPPGAFFALGLLLALKNWIDALHAPAPSSSTALENPATDTVT